MPNVLFLQASVEALPTELEGLANEVYVNFPWGSLLAAVTGGHMESLIKLRRLCSPDGMLKVTVGFDEVRDKTEIERLQLPALSPDFLTTTLATRYREAGFEIVQSDFGSLDDTTVETSWSRRLRANKNRLAIRLVARRVDGQVFDL